MFFLKAAYCRVFQTGFRVALPIMPYREPKIIGSCEALDNVLKSDNIKAVLIVTDKGIVANGLVSPLEAVLTRCGVSYVIYDETRPNPTVENVEQALRLYREQGCNGIIAIGGGSSMDCAKAVGARVVYPKKSVEQMKGILRVLRRLPPLIAIPTTAGTGSETTVAAVVTDPVRQHKYALMSFPLIPHYAVLDASLTCSLPPMLTAITGLDALCHAVEAYIGRSTTKYTRNLALEATGLVFENIGVAYADGTRIEARENMLHAAYKAGLAFSQSYVGYIHAVGHSITGRYGTPHGLVNAVLMPHVLEAYGARIHKKLQSLGMAAGVCHASDSPKEGAEKFIQALKELNLRLGIPQTLPGICREDIPAMAKHAQKEANPLYPVPKLMTQKELEKFYYQIADWSK